MLYEVCGRRGTLGEEYAGSHVRQGMHAHYVCIRARPNGSFLRRYPDTVYGFRVHLNFDVTGKNYPSSLEREQKAVTM